MGGGERGRGEGGEGEALGEATATMAPTQLSLTHYQYTWVLEGAL
jgi:hypothetical protein